MNTISKIIQEMGVVPVVVLHDAKDAKPLAQAFLVQKLHLEQKLLKNPFD